jgi:hypothetical protein
VTAITAERYEIEGDVDLRNFLGIIDEVRPGYSGIRARAFVKGPGRASRS